MTTPEQRLHRIDDPEGAPGRAPAPFRQERARQTAERIVAAALGLLAKHPVEDISVADIARTAGVSVGGFYARFESKAALFAYLNANVLEGIVAQARELLSDEATRDLDARGIVERYIDYAVRSFRKHRLIFQQIALRSRTSQDETFRRRVLELNVELHGLFRGHLTTRVAELGHADPKVATDLALTAVSAVMREYILFGEYRPQFDEVDDERLTAELTDLFCSYLRMDR